MNELPYFLRLVILYGGYLSFGMLPVYHDIVIEKIIESPTFVRHNTKLNRYEV